MSLSVLVRGTSSEIGILGALGLRMHVQKVGEPKRQTCEIPTLCHSQNTCRAFLVGHGDSCAEVYGRSIPEKRSRQREGQAPGALRQVHQLQIDGASAPVAAALFRTCILCVWCVRSVASAAIHAASERSSNGLRAHILLLAWLGWLLSGKPNDGTRSRLPKRKGLALPLRRTAAIATTAKTNPSLAGRVRAPPSHACRRFAEHCGQLFGTKWVPVPVAVPASDPTEHLPRHCRG